MWKTAEILLLRPARAGIRTMLCNIQTPRMNAITERWIGGSRRQLLDRTVIWSQDRLRQILRQYETHHNQHRAHRSLRGASLRSSHDNPIGVGCRAYAARSVAH